MEVKTIIVLILYVNIALIFALAIYNMLNTPAISYSILGIMFGLMPLALLAYQPLTKQNLIKASVWILLIYPTIIYLAILDKIREIKDYQNPFVIEMLNTELEKSSYRDESVILRKLPTLGSDEYIIDNYKSVRDKDKPNAYKVSINYTEKKKYLGIIRIHTTCHLYIDYDTGRVSSDLR